MGVLVLNTAPVSALQRITCNIGGGVRFDTLDGEECLVVDTAMLAEGVWEGSNGPLYYPKDELVQNVDAWNHMPIVVYHPTNNGAGISARDPDVLKTRGVGIILNTRYDDKLRTQAWMKTRRLKEVDKRVYDALTANKTIEVSTGLYTENVGPEGEFGGKKYVAKATKHRPDHLAILPDKVGAYSVAAGGGMLQLNESHEPERTTRILRRGLEEHLKAIGVTVVANEMSFSDVSRALCDALATAYGRPGQYWDGYVVEVYADRVIFRGEDNKLWQVDYTSSDAGVKLTGDAPIQVVRVSEYRAVTTQNSASTQKEGHMAFDKNAHIASLVGNGFEEKDREWLSKLPDDQLAKITPKQTVPPTPATPNPVQVANAVPAPVLTPASTVQPVAPVQPTYQDWLRSAPPEVQRVVNNALAVETQRKTELIAIITANTNNPFSKEFLQMKDVPELEGLARLAQVQQPAPTVPTVNGVPMFGPNYAGAAGGLPTMNNSVQIKEEPLSAPELFAPATK